MPTLLTRTRVLCTLLSLACLGSPALAQAPEPGVLGGPLSADEADPVEDLSVLDGLDVDSTTGALLLHREDLRLGEGPEAFALTRTYKPWTGDLLNAGHHWVTPFDIHFDLNEQGDAATFVGDRGVEVGFTRDAEGVFHASRGPVAWARELVQGGYVVGGLGDDVHYLFDADGWLLARRYQGSEVRFGYDAEHRVRTVTGPWGELQVERDAQGALTAIHAPGRTIRYLRDGDGRVTRVERDGAFEVYGYDPYGRLWDVASGRARILWDTFGRVTSITGDGVHTVRLTYLEGSDDADAALQIRIDRAGEVERVQVSADGSRVKRWAHGSDRPSRSYFDAHERLVRQVQADGRELTFRYDDLGRLLERTDASGTTSFVYGSSATSQPTQITRPDGQLTAMTYDEQGRLTQLEAAAQTVTLRYERGRLVARVDARGNTTRYTYDARGYVRSVEGPTGPLIYTRDEAGRVESLRAPDGRQVKVTYDALGRLTKLRDGRGTIRELEFDARGRVVRRTDELGRRFHYTWTERGDLLELRDALGRLQKYEYDAAGEVVAFEDGAGSRTTLERPDPRTLVVHSDTFGTRTLTHDAVGRLVREQRGAHTLTYDYDARGRLVGRTTPAGAETFAYDDFSRLTRMQGPQGGFALEYDGLGRVTSLEDLTLERRVEYAYDALGDKVAAQLPWGEVGYAYDAQGRVEALTLPNDGGQIRFGYDVNGRRTEVRYPNGTVTRYRYEADRLTRVETTRGDDLVDHRAYGYDARGRIAWSEDAEGRTEYEHDARGRLVAERGPSGAKTYYYDGAGNRIAETTDGKPSVHLIADGNRVRKAGDRVIDYGQTGALTQITAGEETTRYVYDHDDKLVAVHRPDGEVVRYGYAPNGQRLWREDAAGRTDFLNDMADVVGEFRDGELVSSFVHGPDVDDVLAATHGSASFFYHRDLVGSVTAMTDGQGDLAASYRYDAFGNTLAAEGQASDWNPYRYTARLFDAKSGLYDYRARSYDPTLGRFTTPDPLGLLGGANLYAYVLNDPTQFTDPFGLRPWWKRVGDWTRDAIDTVADAAAYVGEKAVDIAVATGKGVVNVVTNPVAFGRGFVKGVWGAAVGIYEMVKNPKAVWEGLKYAWNHPDEMKEMFGNKWREFQDALENDPERFAEIMGTLTADVALAVVGTKGLDKVGKAASALRVASQARAASTVARATSRVARTSTTVRRTAAWTAARTRLLAQRQAALSQLGWGGRQLRRVRYVGQDLAAAARMAVRSPLSFAGYLGNRALVVTGGMAMSTIDMAGKGVKYGGVPLLLTMQGPIQDAINRTNNHEEALGGVIEISRRFLEDAAGMTPEEMVTRLAELNQAHDDYRNQLFRPVHALDQGLEAQMAALNEAVENGEVEDSAVDARMMAIFDEYTSNRLNLMAEVYVGGAEEEHGPLNPSRNRLLAYHDHIDLLRLAQDRLGDSAEDANKREQLERAIADLEARAAYENELFRQGEHDSLLAGINEVPADFSVGVPQDLQLDGLIDPVGAGQ